MTATVDSVTSDCAGEGVLDRERRIRQARAFGLRHHRPYARRRHAAPGLRQRRQAPYRRGRAAATYAGSGRPSRIDHVAETPAPGKIAVQVVEGAVLGVDDHDGRDLRLRSAASRPRRRSSRGPPDCEWCMRGSKAGARPQGSRGLSRAEASVSAQSRARLNEDAKAAQGRQAASERPGGADGECVRVAELRTDALIFCAESKILKFRLNACAVGKLWFH